MLKLNLALGFFVLSVATAIPVQQQVAGVPGSSEVFENELGLIAKRHVPSLRPPEEHGKLKDGVCFGLPNKMCNTNNAGDFSTPDMLQQCKKDFCEPLCLINGARCFVTGNGDFSYLNHEPWSSALCRMVISEGCTESQCCEKNKMMYRWVERAQFPDNTYPQSVLPYTQCRHDTYDKDAADRACKQCMEANVQVHVEIDEAKCKNLANDKILEGRMANAPIHKDKYSNTRGENDLHREDVSKLNLPLDGTFGGNFPSLEEKCEAMLEKLGDPMALAVKKMNENICECLGCCGVGRKCMFPVFDWMDDSASGKPS